MRMSRALACSLLVGLVGLVGCSSLPSPTQRLNDAAYDMNVASRFGRMDVAIEHVSAQTRAEFARRHGEWGRSLRVVDLEFGGMNLKSRSDAEVIVTVTWQRIDESDVRVTSLIQQWHDAGGWRLVSEEEKGDGGLLAKKAPPKGEAKAKPAGSGAAKAAAKEDAEAAPSKEDAKTPPAEHEAKNGATPWRSPFRTRVIHGAEE